MYAKEVNPEFIVMFDSPYHCLLCDTEKLVVLTSLEVLLEAKLCREHRYTV